MSPLLTGGIVAAVAAGWQQVKSFVSYVSSFVIVQADLDDYTSNVVRRHLRKNWKLLPSGQVFYRICYVTFNGKTESTRVPFKLPGLNMVYRQGRRLLFVREQNERLRVLYLRGTLNFETIIVDALTESDQSLQKLGALSAFSVSIHIGRDKTDFSGHDRGESIQRSSGSGLTNSAPSAQMPGIELNIDQSFMYDNALWRMDEDSPSPFANLYYSDEINRYVDQARSWLSKRLWYIDRGIPWRRGWLLVGPGGTGKTSLARAVAKELGLPVHHFFLSTLSDQEFMRAWDGMSTPCMALLEDFDNVFHGREPVGKTTLSFDTVLNQISGMNSANGVFLVVTTNDKTKIDPAMGVSFEGGVSTRPGRIDTVIEVGNLDPRGRLQMAKRILQDWPDLIAQLVVKHEEVTPAQFQELCLQAALERMQLEDSNKPYIVAVPGDIYTNPIYKEAASG